MILSIYHKSSDNAVAQYTQAIAKIIHAQQLRHLSLFDLDEYYTGDHFSTMRKKLISEYGESLESLQMHTRTHLAARLLFNGIHRFVFEDNLFFYSHSNKSRNQIREQSKHLAYQVIQRSNAWSRLLEQQFLMSLRLSIHPQDCGAEKIGIQLLKTNNPWATPWHNVVLKKDDEHYLIKNIEAKQLGARFVKDNSKFTSHYTL